MTKQQVAGKIKQIKTVVFCPSLHKQVQRRWTFHEISSVMKVNSGTLNAQRIGTPAPAQTELGRKKIRRMFPGEASFVRIFILTVPLCLGATKAEAWVNQISQFLTWDQCVYVRTDPFVLSFVYLFFYLLIYFPFSLLFLALISPTHPHYQHQFSSGFCLCMSLHIDWVYCFVSMHFNFCKGLCFLHLILFLPSVTLHCIVHIPPSWRVSLTSNCHLTTLLHLPTLPRNEGPVGTPFHHMWGPWEVDH